MFSKVTVCTFYHHGLLTSGSAKQEKPKHSPASSNEISRDYTTLSGSMTDMEKMRQHYHLAVDRRLAQNGNWKRPQVKHLFY